ncbi:MAG: hypothetical protein V3V35_00530 [Dehalococcoidia bacterium]
MYEGQDIYGRYTACAQCGYYLSEDEQTALVDPGLPPAPTEARA